MTLANDLEDAWITVAKLPPERRTDTLGSLPPRLWEKLRIALQAEYRQATGEPNATLTVTDGAASAARIAELEAEVERLRAGPKVKPLLWGSEPPYAVARVAKLGLTYSTEAVWDDAGVFQCVELSGGKAFGHFQTVDEAKAAAQADYEARVLSALVQP